MISFKKVIERRLFIQIVKATVIGVLVIVALFIKARLAGSIDAVDSTEISILVGLLVGGEVPSLRAIRKYRQSLSSPALLEELHIAETDERNRMVTLKTCRATVQLTVALLGFGGIVALFFSRTVLITIGAILIVILLSYVGLWLYYSRKH
ncbi:MAG: hypothetical protein LBV33_07980 [Lachnospiraceae bacterium]|jgi:uncharacterized membrane protein|nr:hypothetical protein [Lachnospiraceae bacterium]